MQDGELTAEVQLEGDAAAVAPAATAGAAEDRRPVEVAVRALNQRGPRVPAIHASGLGTKIVKRSHRAAGGDSENRSQADASASRSCSIKIAVGGQNQSSDGVGAVCAVCLGAETVNGCHRATGGNLEYRSAAHLFRVARLVGPAKNCCSIQVAIEALNDGHQIRVQTICLSEADEAFKFGGR